MFKPKHTLYSVADSLVHGLRDGTISLEKRPMDLSTPQCMRGDQALPNLGLSQIETPLSINMAVSMEGIAVKYFIRYMRGDRTLPILKALPGMAGTDIGVKDFVRFLLGYRSYKRIKI